MDHRHWTAWLKTHGPALVLAARQWVHDHAAAEDVVQEALLRFWPQREQARDPLALLYVCVKQTALQGHRTARRRIQREAAAARPDWHPSGESPRFAPLQEDERRALVEHALEQLPEAQREVLVMKIWVSLSFPQIAQTLGISPDTAASRYRYALEKLRPILAQEALP